MKHKTNKTFNDIAELRYLQNVLRIISMNLNSQMSIAEQMQRVGIAVHEIENFDVITLTSNAVYSLHSINALLAKLLMALDDSIEKSNILNEQV